MSILRKILSPKQPQEDGTSEQQPPQPSRTFSASNMSATHYNGARDSAMPRPRSEELENVTYCKPSDFLKAAEAAEKQATTTPPERKDSAFTNPDGDAYSDPRSTPQRHTVTATRMKNQQVLDGIRSQVTSREKGTGHKKSRSIGQVMDTSEYSMPWNQVVQEREQQAQQQAFVPNQDGSHAREPEAPVSARQSSLQDFPGLNHHYETPANSNPRPPKPPRTHVFTESVDVRSTPPPIHQPFTSPPGTIDRATTDHHSPGQPGDYDEPWENKTKFKLPHKPRQQEPLVAPRDRISPPPPGDQKARSGDQKARSERMMRRTPTPDDSIMKRSIGSDMSSSVGSLGSTFGSHFDRPHPFSTDVPTASPRPSRPLPPPPVPTARRPSPSPGAVQPNLALDEQP